METNKAGGAMGTHIALVTLTVAVVVALCIMIVTRPMSSTECEPDSCDDDGGDFAQDEVAQADNSTAPAPAAAPAPVLPRKDLGTVYVDDVLDVVELIETQKMKEIGILVPFFYSYVMNVDPWYWPKSTMIETLGKPMRALVYQKNDTSYLFGFGDDGILVPMRRMIENNGAPVQQEHVLSSNGCHFRLLIPFFNTISKRTELSVRGDSRKIFNYAEFVPDQPIPFKPWSPNTTIEESCVFNMWWFGRVADYTTVNGEYAKLLNFDWLSSANTLYEDASAYPIVIPVFTVDGMDNVNAPNFAVFKVQKRKGFVQPDGAGGLSGLLQSVEVACVVLKSGTIEPGRTYSLRFTATYGDVVEHSVVRLRFYALIKP